jgi:F-type H+-transporting ATPase subunit b
LIPDLSVFWVIAFVLLLSVVLDRLLLRPLTRVMNEREGAVRTARELAESSRTRAQAAADEFESRTRAARGEIYQMMEDKRRAAVDERGRLVAETRAEVERTVGEATARVAAQSSVARRSLEQDVDALAITIAERVLGRKAS